MQTDSGIFLLLGKIKKGLNFFKEYFGVAGKTLIRITS